MGTVYKARQMRLNRIVALKTIKAGALANDREIRLFQREAEAVAALDHPNIVPILETGEQRGPALLQHEADRRQEPPAMSGPIPEPAGGDRPAGRPGRRRDPPRPPARRLAPRLEAVEHPGGRQRTSRT